MSYTSPAFYTPDSGSLYSSSILDGGDCGAATFAPATAVASYPLATKHYTSGKPCNPGKTLVTAIVVVVVAAVLIGLLAWLNSALSNPSRSCFGVKPAAGIQAATRPPANTFVPVPGNPHQTTAPYSSTSASPYSSTSVAPVVAPATTAPSSAAQPVNARRIDAQGLQQVKSSGAPAVVMYAAPWCGPCKQTLPQFDAAAVGSSVPHYYIEADDIPPSEGIQGFPTIRLHNAPPGTARDHTGRRTTDEIRKFANSGASSAQSSAAHTAGRPGCSVGSSQSAHTFTPAYAD